MDLNRSLAQSREALLLKASLGVSPGSASWWELYWAGGIDRRHGYLLGGVYLQLEREDYQGPGLPELQRAYLATWTRYLQQLKIALRTLADLRAGGVQPVLLKGLAVSCLLGWSGHRAMDDFDLLIKPEEFDRAVHLLSLAGWTADLPFPDSERRAIQHSHSWHQQGHHLDLHWFTMPESLDRRWDDESRARAQTLVIEGQNCLAMAPTDLLLHTLVHGCKSGSRQGWVADSWGLLRGADLDWSLFVTQAQQRRVILQCRAGLTFLATQMQAPVPAGVLRALAEQEVNWIDQLYFQVKTRPRRIWTFLLWPILEYLRLPQGQRAKGFFSYLRLRWGGSVALFKEIPRRLRWFLATGGQS